MNTLHLKSLAPLLAAICVSQALGSPAAAALPLPTSAGGAYSVSVTSWRDIPFRRVVRQQYDYSCGSAALATLLHYHYGRPVGEAEIFKAMYDVGDQKTIRTEGFSLLDLKRYLKAAGLSADGFRVGLADVERLGVPGIVLITTGSYKHFVVIKGIAGKRVLVGDPAIGSRTYDAAEFSKLWTSGLFFAITDSGGQFNDRQEWMQHLGPVADPYLAEQGAGAMLRNLPPLYQITRVLDRP